MLYKVKTNTAEERNSLIVLLLSQGYVYGMDSLNSLNRINERSDYEYWPIFSFDNSTKQLNSYGSTSKYDFAWPAHAHEIIQHASIASQKVENISGDYDAIVTLDGIDVGCQHISFEKFDELCEVVAKVRS